METTLNIKFKNSTPVFQTIEKYEDADDEMQEMAKYIKKTTQHNEYIEPEKIKFLYSNKPKKDGRFVLFDLIKRSDIEKMIDARFDFIVTVFYDVWKTLEVEQKVIQLDRALCGIDMGSMESQKLSKKSPDCKEYVSNMLCYGADKVMKISEIVHLACERIIEEKKQNKGNKAAVPGPDDII